MPKIELSKLDASMSQHKFLNFNKVAVDTRRVGDCDVFVALSGTAYDTHADVLKLSAQYKGQLKAIFVEKDVEVAADFLGQVFRVNDTKWVLAQLAAAQYEFPTRDLFVVGVTGTNGKTTLVYLLEWLLRAFQFRPGVLGTIDHHFEGQSWETQHTTPPPIELQKRVREFVDSGATALAMEVSSHAIHQRRSDAIEFNGAIFTNLTQDHLDYHGTLDAYFKAKSQLFTHSLVQSTKHSGKFAVINQDDSRIQKFFEQASLPFKVVQFSIEGTSDLYASEIKMSHLGTEFVLNFAETDLVALKVQTPLVGKYNVQNALAALGVVYANGWDMPTAVAALANFPGVPGRMQMAKLTNGASAFVDYAHTPDALEKACLALKETLPPLGKLLVVFGCGGDRDQTKRPLMAHSAEKYADWMIVTNDNPRSEDPAHIIAQIRSGFNDQRFEIEPDRRRAISIGLNKLNFGDVLLVAGKGHENYQEINGIKNYFSDIETIQDLIKKEQQQ